MTLRQRLNLSRPAYIRVIHRRVILHAAFSSAVSKLQPQRQEPPALVWAGGS
jgi:hypothetical protein